MGGGAKINKTGEIMESNKLKTTCIYYDKDLKELTKLFNLAKNILDEIEIRFARKDTLEISTSIFSYMEKQVMKVRDPHPFYRYCDDEIEIYIYCPKKGSYNIRIDNVDKIEIPEDFTFTKYLDFEKSWTLEKSFNDLGIVEKLFRNLVESYLTKKRFGYGLF